MALTNSKNRAAFHVNVVNLKTAASTIIVPAMTGLRFLPRAAFLRFELVSSISVGPTISIGGGAAFAGLTNIVDHQVISASTCLANRLVELVLNGSTFMWAMDIGSTGISVTVDTGATGTSLTGDIFLEGFIV